MSYEKNERIEVIRQAYVGLYQFASSVLFNKYVDFIDVYAKINPEEQNALYREIVEHQETAMLAQYIREKGKQEGLQQGKQEGLQQGKQEGLQQGKQEGLQQGMLQTSKAYIIEILELRFGKVSEDIIQQIQQINDPNRLKNLLRKAIQLKKMDRSGFFC
jgi:flagellar biosynthesis/type III secretory pathway protein FliH